MGIASDELPAVPKDTEKLVTCGRSDISCLLPEGRGEGVEDGGLDRVRPDGRVEEIPAFEVGQGREGGG